ncbi:MULTISPECIES: PH domain-containing protein [Micrococcus]|uniref:PH domain-containing protein n=1 Tax=Micrococcus antarcticus TaxID=86171 RepID=UPI00384C1F8C
MSAAAPQPPRTDDDGWARVHPASPWVKGWTGLLVMVFVIGRDLVEDAVAGALGQSHTASGDPVDPRSLLIGGAIAAGVFTLVCLAFYFSWRFTRFRLGTEEIELRQGWIFRSRRQMKYDRVQAVDLQHPFPARLLGLATVKVEAADGGESALELAYLRRTQAEQVRREILDRSSGVAHLAPGADEAAAAAVVAPGEGADVGAGTVGDAAGQTAPPRALRTQDEGELMLAVPTGRLIGSVLLSGRVAGVAIGFLVWALLSVTFLGVMPANWSEGEEITVLGVLGASALPMAFAVLGGLWSGLNTGWGFQVRRSADGLRLRHGLTETTSQTVPPGRVQGVTVSQSLFWRPFRWYRVKVSVAGYGEDSGGERSTALPVGTWEDVLRVLTVVAPDPGLEGDPRAAQGLTAAELLRLGLHGSGPEGGFRHIPRRARAWFNWFAWRRSGFTTTRTLLVVRRGYWNRSFQALQHERLQTASLGQGPVQRRLRIASVSVALAGSTAVIPDLDEADALALFALESRYAAVSRRLADRNHWMAPEELARFDQRTREVAATDVGRRALAEAGVAVVPGAGRVPAPTDPEESA